MGRAAGAFYVAFWLRVCVLPVGAVYDFREHVAGAFLCCILVASECVCCLWGQSMTLGSMWLQRCPQLNRMWGAMSTLLGVGG